MRRLLLLCLLLLCLPTWAFSAVLLTEEWEGGHAPVWNNFGGGFADGGPFVVDSPVGPSPSGGKVLRLLYPTGHWPSSVSAGRAGTPLADLDEVYIGHWNYYSTNWFANSNGTKMDFVIWGPGSDNVSIGFYGNGCGGGTSGSTTDMSAIQPQITWMSAPGFCNNVHLPLGQWHWVEYRLVMNTPLAQDGIFEIRVDGVLKATHTTVAYRQNASEHFNNFVHTAEWGGGGTQPCCPLPSPNMYWLVDHTVISTTPIGVPGAGTPTSNCSSISWNANTESDLGGYKLYDRPNVLVQPQILVTTSNQPSLPCDDHGLDTGQHFISLSAFDQTGNESQRGPEQSLPFNPLPSQVTGLTIIQGSSLTVNSAAAGDNGFITKYNTERCTGSGCSNFTVVHSSLNLNFVNGGLQPNTVYCYRRNAEDNLGQVGAYSAVVCATTSAAAGAPTARILSSDSCDRADAANMGGNWTIYAGKDPIKIASNGCSASTLAVHAAEYDNTVALPADQHRTMTLRTFSGASPREATILLRSNGSDTQYLVRVLANWFGSPDTLRFSRDLAGVNSNLKGNTSQTFGDGDVVEGTVVGSTVCAYRNTVLVDCVIDTAIAAGTRSGLLLYTEGALTANVVESTSGGDFVSTAIPIITGASATATTLTITHGATTPTFVRMVIGGNSGVISDLVHPIASFPGLVFTLPAGGWPTQATFACVVAQNAAHTESTDPADTRCVNVATEVTLDTTAPVISGGLPNTTLVQGTTFTTLFWQATDLSPPIKCRVNLTNVAYSAMTLGSGFSSDGNNFTFPLSGLTNGSTTPVYVRCEDSALDSAGNSAVNANSASTTITVVVAASGGDTTLPSAPSLLTCSNTGSTTGSCTFTVGGDNIAVVGYELWLCGGVGCINFNLHTNWGTTSPQLLAGLAGNITYTAKAKSFDAAGNRSALFSNDSTFTTTPGSLLPPPDLATLSLLSNTYNNVTLVWGKPVGLFTTRIEKCEGVGCTLFKIMGTTPHSNLQDNAVQPITLYSYRGKLLSEDGVPSVNYTTVLDVTTPDIPSGTQLGICPCRNRSH